MSAKKLVKTGGGIRIVRSDLATSFPDPEGWSVASGHLRKYLRVIKQGANRTVYRLNLPKAGLYLKHYKTPNLQSRLKNLLRGSTARQEFVRAEEIRKRGISTFTPLALSECLRAGLVTDSFLVTREIAGAIPLDSYFKMVFPTLDGRVQGQVRRKLAYQLADLIANMHAQGIAHDDLHPGNLLIEIEGIRPVRLHLIDLQSARVSRSLGWNRSRRNLALLNLWFFQRTNRSDRFRFLRAYLDRRAELGKTVHAAAEDIEQRTWQVALRLWRHNAGRCLRWCRDFYRLDANRYRAFALRQIPQSLVRNLLENPDALLAEPGSVRLKTSLSATVSRVTVSVDGCEEFWVIKRVKSRSWWHGLIRSNAARRAWQAGHALLDSHVPTPRPQVMIETRVARFGRAAYLFTPWIAGSQTLDRYVQERIAKLSLADQRKEIRALIVELAALIRRLHESHFDHRDLKAVNLLVAPRGRDETKQMNDLSPPCTEAAGGSPGVVLLDLDCVKRRRRLSPSRCAQNLARLHVSFHADALITRTDKLRFLRRYLPWGLAGHRDWKSLWRHIDRLTEKKIRRNQRRGRVIS